MAKGLSAPRRAAGFTLVELMIASLIFSMVIAGFAAIYSTAFSQSGQVLREARLKSNGLVSFKSITKQMAAATRIDQPAAGASGSVLTGCANMAPDSTQHVAGGVSAFGFCIQTGSVGACGTPDTPPPCLFSYAWNTCPSPGLSSGNCGNTVGSSAAQLLSSRVLLPSGYTDYFMRAGTGSAVRISMQYRRDASGKIPEMNYEVTTVAHGHFDSRL